MKSTFRPYALVGDEAKGVTWSVRFTWLPNIVCSQTTSLTLYTATITIVICSHYFTSNETDQGQLDGFQLKEVDIVHYERAVIIYCFIKGNKWHWFIIVKPYRWFIIMKPYKWDWSWMTGTLDNYYYESTSSEVMYCQWFC